MEVRDNKLIKVICIDICEEGRCQRYPRLSMSCSKFRPLDKAYKAGQESEKAHWVGEIERQVCDAYEAGIREAEILGNGG